MSSDSNDTPPDNSPDQLTVVGLEQLTAMQRMRLLSHLGELGLTIASAPEQGEVLAPEVVTYEDTLDFAGEKKRHLVSTAWGLLFNRMGYESLEQRHRAGIVVVNPEGEVDLDASPRFYGGRTEYEGWGVTFESLAHAIDTGSLENINALKKRTGSYKLFEDFVNSKRPGLDQNVPKNDTNTLS